MTVDPYRLKKNSILTKFVLATILFTIPFYNIIDLKYLKYILVFNGNVIWVIYQLFSSTRFGRFVFLLYSMEFVFFMLTFFYKKILKILSKCYFIYLWEIGYVVYRIIFKKWPMCWISNFLICVNKKRAIFFIFFVKYFLLTFSCKTKFSIFSSFLKSNRSNENKRE